MGIIRDSNQEEIPNVYVLMFLLFFFLERFHYLLLETKMNGIINSQLNFSYVGLFFGEWFDVIVLFSPEITCLKLSVYSQVRSTTTFTKTCLNRRSQWISPILQFQAIQMERIWKIISKIKNTNSTLYQTMLSMLFAFHVKVICHNLVKHEFY